MSKHTPGEWRIPVANVFRVIALNSDGSPKRIILDGCPDGHFGSQFLKWEDDDGPEMAANARLIAAAPDLLAACEAAAKLLDFGAVFEQCREAIQKAKGAT